MIKKTWKEWTLDMPWGKLAMMSWGDPANPPMLLVHGLVDTAATFIYLVDLLPDTYYYVAFDFPGNGLSDPFPPGPLLSHAHLVNVIKLVVDRLKWDKFIYMSHSLGNIIGAIFNTIHPGRITKMITIDMEGSTGFFYYITHDFAFWIQYYFIEYYENYARLNGPTSKLYTKEEAINVIANNRNLSLEQAETVLSRSLVPVEDGLYKMSWEPRVKKLVSLFISEETFFNILTKNTPPTLNFNAGKRLRILPQKCRELSAKLMRDMEKTIPNYLSINIKARHDLHITNPQDMVGHIKKFLKKEFRSHVVKSKL